MTVHNVLQDRERYRRHQPRNVVSRKQHRELDPDTLTSTARSLSTKSKSDSLHYVNLNNLKNINNK